MTRKTKTASEPPLREPTERERSAIAKATASRAARPLRPAIKFEVENRVGKISALHSDREGWAEQLTDAFGTRSGAFTDTSMARIIGALHKRSEPPTETEVNAALALMAAIEPQNELEAVMAEQIIAAHAASLDFLSRARLNAGEYRDTAVAYASVATKLSRTMATHIDALAKLRNGGKQQVIVKHVYVDARGSQNVIGSEIHGGPGAMLGKPEQPHEPTAIARLAAASGPEVWSEEQARDAVPVAGDAR